MRSAAASRRAGHGPALTPRRPRWLQRTSPLQGNAGGGTKWAAPDHPNTRGPTSVFSQLTLRNCAKHQHVSWRKRGGANKERKTLLHCVRSACAIPAQWCMPPKGKTPGSSQAHEPAVTRRRSLVACREWQPSATISKRSRPPSPSGAASARRPPSTAGWPPSTPSWPALDALTRLHSTCKEQKDLLDEAAPG